MKKKVIIAICGIVIAILILLLIPQMWFNRSEYLGVQAGMAVGDALSTLRKHGVTHVLARTAADRPIGSGWVDLATMTPQQESQLAAGGKWLIDEPHSYSAGQFLLTNGRITGIKYQWRPFEIL